MATAIATKLSAREALRSRIQLRADAKISAQKVRAAANKFATLRHLALEEPQEVDSALGQLAEGFSELSQALQSMSQNLDLGGLPATASLKARVAAKRNYASRLRRIAEEAPEQFEAAYNEVYSALDGLAEDMENAADNLGIVLDPPVDGAPFGGPEESSFPPVEEDISVEEDIKPEGEEHEEEEEKEASGGDWFVTDRNEKLEPKSPTTASARKSVVNVRK